MEKVKDDVVGTVDEVKDIKQPSKEIKVEIVQSENGMITLQTFSDLPVSVAHLVGIMEIAKVDLLHNTVDSQKEDVVEMTVDELDIKLNPGAELVLGDTIKIPRTSALLRDQMRREALSNTEGPKVEA